ncbi:MAG: L-seryl-tRNA(Sec) selenium transferase [Tissierellia bacterium]|nr:L-seryl-tRNA(Sec) selenium transferase [Tissierellia bacterium]
MEKLRLIPKVHDLLEDPALAAALEEYDRAYINHLVNENLSAIRQDLLSGKDRDISREAIIASLIEELESPYALREVINATGIVLHTNLGRAPLSRAALERIEILSRGYSNLEYDLEVGKRGSRYDHLRRHLQYLTGAEDAHVVNNNAAAVFLVLNTFTQGKEIILSRGEMIEIGESFRIPEIIKNSGAKLVEIGTTNKTHLWDYEDAINDETGMIMKVHPSNYFVGGFSQGVEARDLSLLAKKRGILLYEDVGSGSLLEEGLFREKNSVRQALAHVDLISFSGDKLLAGPQAGIILGSKEHIKALKKNQLTRVLRVDKLILAALEATLLAYTKKDIDLPSYFFLNRTYEELELRSEDFLSRLKALGIEGELVNGESLVGGGALPETTIASPQIALRVNKNLEEVNYRLRKRRPAIVAVLDRGVLKVDLRCIYPEDEGILFEALKEVIL